MIFRAEGFWVFVCSKTSSRGHRSDCKAMEKEILWVKATPLKILAVNRAREYEVENFVRSIFPPKIEMTNMFEAEEKEPLVTATVKMVLMQ